MILDRFITRFTRESRRCVEAAVQEAVELGHDSVGDEDLLLGILRVDDGISAGALASLGVTLEAVRSESEEMTSEALASIGISLEDIHREVGNVFGWGLTDAREVPFSPRAKRALEEALKQALRMGDNFVTTEHVLLGIIANGDGTAVRILARLGVSTDALEERVYGLRRLA